jgi:hypothetical protein
MKLSKKQEKVIINPKMEEKSFSKKLISELKEKRLSRIDEKAVSKQQQKYFGLVRAIQKGEASGSPEAEKTADGDLDPTPEPDEGHEEDEKEKPPHNKVTILSPIIGKAVKKFVITVAAQKLI